MILLDILEVLEQNGSLHILLCLLEEGELRTSELLRKVPVGQTAFYTAIRKLLTANLIEDNKSGYPVTRIFRLTKKGKYIAKNIKRMLEEIEKIKD